MVAKIGTNADCISCWPNFYPMQVAFYLAREITQVLDAIPWVRCASGNVWRKNLHQKARKLQQMDFTTK